MHADLFDVVVVPIADPNDARETADAVRRYLSTESELIVTHVVPKGDGVPDKASVEQREKFAEAAYETFIEEFPDGKITPLTLYGRNVAETIIDGANEADATSIVFTPRGASRWAKLLTGSVSENLIENTDIPVLVLPKPENRTD